MSTKNKSLDQVTPLTSMAYPVTLDCQLFVKKCASTLDYYFASTSHYLSFCSRVMHGPPGAYEDILLVFQDIPRSHLTNERIENKA